MRVADSAIVRHLGRAAVAIRPLLPGLAAWRMFGALLVCDLVYRGALLAHLLHDLVTPFSFVPNKITLAAFARSVAYDFAVLAAGAFALGLIARGLLLLAPRAWRPRLERAGWYASGALVLFNGTLDAVHLRTMIAMHQGLDTGMLAEVFTAGGGRDLLDYIEPSDWLMLLAPPVVLYLFSRRAPQRWSVPRDRVVLALCGLCALLYLPLSILAHPMQRGSRLKPAMRMPPVVYLAGDAIDQLRGSPNSYPRLAERLPPLIVPAMFFDQRPGPLAAASPPPPHGAWNVLLVMMESTGARYAFDEKRANQVPMPILADLAAHGLYLAHHYASANTSPRAIFSIFTGLYPEPMETMFCTRPDVRIPGLGSALGRRYERFFITPGRLKSYLPRAMLEHQGISEVHGYDELPSQYIKPFPGAGRNEVQTASFFIDRVARAREPFFATYYSYAPHYDYFDHGPQYRILDDLDDPENRYYNNLRLLDTQIGRFIDALRASGKLDSTIVVLVGDHGEGFGQHPGNYTHSRGSFEENLRVPAILYQPKLFAAHKLQEPTTHADLLPTLLDALGIAYDQNLIQGQSLLRGPPRRPYIYSWGNEGTLTSLDTQSLRKLHISFTENRCRYYELEQDSHEHSEHPCGPESQVQLNAALRYYAFQSKALQRYNAELLKEADARALR